MDWWTRLVVWTFVLLFWDHTKDERYKSNHNNSLWFFWICAESHIARVFKKHTGTTIISYVHKVRIEKSIQMMEEENLSVKEAALAAGYQNLNHFYKYFNEQYPNLINKGYFALIWHTKSKQKLDLTVVITYYCYIM